MPTAPWATAIQLEFLKGRRGDFSAAQESKTLPAFWADIYHDFFIRWPNWAAEVQSVNDIVDIPDESSNKKKTKKKAKLVSAPTAAAPESHEAWVSGRKNVCLTANLMVRSY